jgi:hypothetical protein
MEASRENHCGMITTGESSWYAYRSSLVITSSHLVVNQEGLTKEMITLASRSILVHTWKGFLTCRKILRHGVSGFSFPSKKVMLRIFIALKHPSPPARFEPAKPGSNGKHASYHTTEDDYGVKPVSAPRHNLTSQSMGDISCFACGVSCFSSVPLGTWYNALKWTTYASFYKHPANRRYIKKKLKRRRSSNQTSIKN